MEFAHDTEMALRGAVDLVNTAHGDTKRLPDPAALEVFLDEQDFSGARAGTEVDLAEVQALRRRVAAVWDADDCDPVLVDLSRNRSRRYGDTGNCRTGQPGTCRAHITGTGTWFR